VEQLIKGETTVIEKPMEPIKVEPVKVEPVKTAPVAKKEPTKLRDRTPAYWNITENDGNTITARNSNTGEVFQGTMLEFNVAMRG
jgi:hypothetical protein